MEFRRFLITLLAILCLCQYAIAVPRKFANINELIRKGKEIMDPNPATRCRLESKFILENFDSEKDPCDNFYQFACGKIIQNPPLSNLRQINAIDEAVERSLSRVEAWLNAPIRDDDRPNTKRLKIFFTSCKNFDYHGDIILSKDTLIGLGGFPMLKDLTGWEDRGTNWMDALISLRNTGLRHNSMFQVKADSKLNIEILPIRTSKWTGDNSEREKEKYRQIIRQIDPRGAEIIPLIEGKLEQMYRFRVRLAGIYSNRLKQMYIRVSDLVDRIPEFDWKNFFSELASADVQLDQRLKTFQMFPNIVDLISRTDKNVLIDHIFMFALEEYFLDLDVKNLAERDKLKKCLIVVNEKLGATLSQEYLRDYLSSDNRRLVNFIFGEIQEQFVRFLFKSNMTLASRHQAEDKIRSMKHEFGQDQENNGFGDLPDFQPDNYLRNIFLTNRHSDLSRADLSHRKHLRFGKTQYNEDKNIILIGISLLDESIIDSQRPDYMNFAHFGTLVASAIAKATIKIDEFESVYSALTQCLIEQIQRHDGTEILQLGRGDDISNDITSGQIGLAIAYGAYNNYRRRQGGPEPILAETNLTQDQLFMVTYGSLMCKENDPAKQSYPPAELKLNLPLWNLLQFSQIFKCPVNSPMNPENKC